MEVSAVCSRSPIPPGCCSEVKTVFVIAKTGRLIFSDNCRLSPFIYVSVVSPQQATEPSVDSSPNDVTVILERKFGYTPRPKPRQNIQPRVVRSPDRSTEVDSLIDIDWPDMHQILHEEQEQMTLVNSSSETGECDSRVCHVFFLCDHADTEESWNVSYPFFFLTALYTSLW